MENESQVERIIKDNPHQFKDELDKWLFREFDISGGACSSIESMRYSLAKEVAEKAMEYAKQQIMKDAVVAAINSYEEIGGEGYVEFIANIPVEQYRKEMTVRLLIIKDKEV